MTFRSGTATLSFFFFSPSYPTFLTSPGTNLGCGCLLFLTKAQNCRRLRRWFCDSFRNPLFRVVAHLPAWLRNVCSESPHPLGLAPCCRMALRAEWICKKTVSLGRWFILALSEKGNPQGPGVSPVAASGCRAGIGLILWEDESRRTGW